MGDWIDIGAAAAAKLDLEDGDVVLLRARPQATATQSKLLADAIKKQSNKSVLVVSIPVGVELQAVSEEGMNLHGWYRKPLK